jgi:uncharacterized protein YlaI
VIEKQKVTLEMLKSIAKTLKENAVDIDLCPKCNSRNIKIIGNTDYYLCNGCENKFEKKYIIEY